MGFRGTRPLPNVSGRNRYVAVFILYFDQLRLFRSVSKFHWNAQKEIEKKSHFRTPFTEDKPQSRACSDHNNGQGDDHDPTPAAWRATEYRLIAAQLLIDGALRIAAARSHDQHHAHQGPTSRAVANIATGVTAVIPRRRRL